MKPNFRPTIAAAIGLCATVAAAQAPTAIALDFEGAATDQLPCEPGLTGGGGAVDWQVLEDPTAPAGPRVLAETTADRTNNRYPLCILPEPAIADVAIAVSFKAVSGTVDQAAGVMVRVQDENNYYIARANALEGNVRFYKVENGQRVQVAGANINVPSGQWQALELRVRGNAIEVLFNGVSLFSTGDGTFANRGRVGLWTKADSVTYFDQLIVTPL